MQLPTIEKIYNTTEELNKETEIIKLNLGNKPKWYLTRDTTSGGKQSRRKMEHDYAVSMRSTCIILAHMHKLKDV